MYHVFNDHLVTYEGGFGPATIMMKSLKTLLVANRGEIACRLIRSAKYDSQRQQSSLIALTAQPGDWGSGRLQSTPSQTARPSTCNWPTKRACWRERRGRRISTGKLSQSNANANVSIIFMRPWPHHMRSTRQLIRSD